MEHTTSSRALKWALIIGIVIILNLFFGYALSLAYPAPNYNNFCPESQIVNPPETQTACLKAGGQWIENVVPVEDTGVPPIPQEAPAKNISTVPQTTGYCNATYTCGNSYDVAQKTYEENVFIALVILGIISVAVGLFWKTTETVSVGLSLGGVLSLVIASVRYWSEAGHILRVVILALALIALIWLGSKKFKN